MRHRESENGSIFQTALVFVRMNKPTIGRYKMKVSSKAIVNGEFEDKYGKRGSQFSPSGMPSYSIPFEIEDAPEGTKIVCRGVGRQRCHFGIGLRMDALVDFRFETHFRGRK